MSSPVISPSNLNALYCYVGECTRERGVENKITNMLKKQPPLMKEKIVWRGHVMGPTTIDPRSWFSTANNREAVQSFIHTESGCCIFKIHLMPGIRVMNVKEVLRSSRNKRSSNSSRRNRSNSHSSARKTLRNRYINSMLDEEDELIVEGGGVFYTTANAYKEGFIHKGGVFESYYFPHDMRTSFTEIGANELVGLIDKKEYEYINSPNDFDFMGIIPKGVYVSHTTKQNALRKIKNAINHR
jgi:hypothetical protein